MKLLKSPLNLDNLGITASVLCAVHCAIVPLLITFLPLWGLSFLANEWVEISMISISLLLGIWSLGSSFKKNHHKISPLSILITGFALIAFGHFSSHDFLEPILIPAGGIVIAIAHFVNLKLLKSCGVKHNH
ncbi:MerC domain-containing protein [Pedobacter aquatilis]|uniref:MerC domain-containing protein n=1 Tax=Pedobacter aquatilis TaxID=351343 RepID=UPI0025B4B4EC|nr:MerC domain-containing protein [Pedobacter aquatilis]MDN3585720.1 MerC domain-containing protein [Pedobacter aquatilis]